jgi:alpha-tubulin suppressor-like RCC1 family protein
VHCFGRNNAGQLGYGNEENIGDNEFPSAVGSVVMGFPVEAFTTGGSHSCAVSTGDQIRCWGRGFSGRLGYANEDDIGDDERPDTVGPVQPGAAVTSVNASVNHTCAILIDGGVRCWGEGNRGALGYGNENDIGDDELPLTTEALVFDPAPVQIVGGLQHTCVLLEDGSVRCWGAGTLGQHGAGTMDDLGDDERADELPSVNFGGADVVALTAGDSHTCALLSTGDVRCWGANSLGQLGRGHTEDIGDDETPAAEAVLSFESPVASIDAGGNHTCVVLEDTTVRCWGSNFNSELGLPGRPTDEPVGDDELPTDVDPVRILD